MAITFENEKILFDDKYGTAKEIDCFLPVHLTIGGKENDLYKKDGSHNEQYYKWQFLYCFVSAGLCSKDFIGVEVSFPKGNKNSASIKLDAAIFDNKDWFEHYSALHTKKDDSKWDELNWLKEHLICGIEFKKEGSKDIKTHYSGVSPEYEKYYNNDLVSQIAKSSNNVVEYFTEEFEINNKFMHKDDDRVNTFMYPYISELLDKLIQNNHPYMEFALKNAINHSQKTLDFIKDSITDSIESTAEIYKATYQEDQLSQLKISFIDKATEDLTLYDNCHAIKYFDLFGRTGKGITTTIACVSAKSNDALINRLINELNSLYDRIKNIKNEFIKES